MYIHSAGIPAVAGIIGDAVVIFSTAARATYCCMTVTVDDVPALLHVVIAVFTVVFSVDFLYLLLL